jgi:hypothetical protein
MQEVDREDPGGLGVQELLPRRARPARRWIDARGVQDLPDGGRRDRHAELGQLAVDPAVSPLRVLPRQANGKAGDAPDCWRAAGLASFAGVILSPGQPAMPGQQGRGCHGEDPGPAAAGDERRKSGEPGPVARLVPHPADVPAQHRVLVPEHQQFSILRPVPAERQDSQAQ